MVNHEDSASKSASKLVISDRKLLILLGIINEIWALSKKKDTETPHSLIQVAILRPRILDHTWQWKSSVCPLLKDFLTKKTFKENIPYAPWCWNIYHHVPHKSASYVGK